MNGGCLDSRSRRNDENLLRIGWYEHGLSITKTGWLLSAGCPPQRRYFQLQGRRLGAHAHDPT